MNSLANKVKKAFLDSVKITVKGGSGGPGLPQYGGIGGKGGDVYISGSSKVQKLSSIYKTHPNGFFEAGNGRASVRTRLLGQAGKDLTINVPLGVTIEDLDKQFIGEINKPRDKVIVALGGRGGDKFNDNQGFKGQKRVIRLDLKVISDAVLVGFPNAGKSSLLREISNAKPKVAEYPFTTLRPYLGIVNYQDYRTISVADLPGLVEGAHRNLGLGHEFLKHIERSKLLVFLVDINDNPLETISVLIKEIELYDDTLLRKPAILAASKMDIDGARDKYSQFESNVRTIHPFKRVTSLSSVNYFNINKFKNIIREVIDEEAESERPKNFSTYRELQLMENNKIIQ